MKPKALDRPNRSPASPTVAEAREDDGAKRGYEVGYGKPPAHSQFRPGQAGGPGRPRGSKNRATLFKDAFDAPRPVVIGGKRARMTNQAIAYRELAKQAAQGNLRAIALAEQIRAQVCGAEQTAEPVADPLTEAELAILNRRSHD